MMNTAITKIAGETFVADNKAFIFDMDGLLIDSEPLWYEAANDAFSSFGFSLSEEEYAGSIGLRTKEFVAYWFRIYNIHPARCAEAEKAINTIVVDKIIEKGEPMPGVHSVLHQLGAAGVKIGLATSSPSALIDIVVNKLGIRDYFTAFASAEALPYGKPHPQVYLNCAMALDVLPTDCVCFEDSFNGLIAAKAARMKCIAVPPPQFAQEPRFRAADLILNSLEEFNFHMLATL